MLGAIGRTKLAQAGRFQRLRHSAAAVQAP